MVMCRNQCFIRMLQGGCFGRLSRCNFNGRGTWMFSCLLHLCCCRGNSFLHNIVNVFVICRNIVLDWERDLFRRVAFLHTIVAVFFVRRNIISVLRFFFCLLLACLCICKYAKRKRIVDDVLNRWFACVVGFDVDNLIVCLHLFQMGSQAIFAFVPLYGRKANGKFSFVVGVDSKPPSLVALSGAALLAIVHHCLNLKNDVAFIEVIIKSHNC